MKTSCPHCSRHIEIDAETLASLQGSSHFACPACSGAVPVPPLSGSLPLAPPHDPETDTLPVASPAAHAHRGLSRNLLILGAATLLVLGGLAFFIASRKAGDTHLTNQNVHNEIINNTYFRQLISEEKTTEKYLEAITRIQAHDGGYIGISKEAMSWKEAESLAGRVGGEVLTIPGSSYLAAPLLMALGRLSEKLENHGSPLFWVMADGKPRVLDGAEAMPAAAPENAYHVLLHWPPPARKTGEDEPSWVSAEVPAPDAEGWITLFDGKKLYACDAEPIRSKPNLAGLGNGYLWLHHGTITFNVTARNVILRATVKKINGQNLSLQCRIRNTEAGLGQKSSVVGWYNGGSDFGIGISNAGFSGFRDLRSGQSQVKFSHFVPVEFSAIGDMLTFKVDGAEIITAKDPYGTGTSEGKVSVAALWGQSLFQRIQVKILDSPSR